MWNSHKIIKKIISLCTESHLTQNTNFYELGHITQKIHYPDGYAHWKEKTYI